MIPALIPIHTAIERTFVKPITINSNVTNPKPNTSEIGHFDLYKSYIPDYNLRVLKNNRNKK